MRSLADATRLHPTRDCGVSICANTNSRICCPSSLGETVPNSGPLKQPGLRRPPPLDPWEIRRELRERLQHARPGRLVHVEEPQEVLLRRQAVAAALLKVTQTDEHPGQHGPGEIACFPEVFCEDLLLEPTAVYQQRPELVEVLVLS